MQQLNTRLVQHFSAILAYDSGLGLRVERPKEAKVPWPIHQLGFLLKKRNNRKSYCFFIDGFQILKSSRNFRIIWINDFQTCISSTEIIVKSSCTFKRITNIIFFFKYISLDVMKIGLRRKYSLFQNKFVRLFLAPLVFKIHKKIDYNPRMYTFYANISHVSDQNQSSKYF